MGKSWTLQEVEDLRRLKTIEGLKNKEISEILERTKNSIYSMTKKMKFLKFCFWDKQSEELLKHLIFDTHFKIKEIAKKIGKTENATKMRMLKLFGSSSLKKLRNESFLKNSETRFREEEIEFLKKNYYEKGSKGCARVLKRTSTSLEQKVQCFLKIFR